MTFAHTIKILNILIAAAESNARQFEKEGDAVQAAAALEIAKEYRAAIEKLKG